MLRKILNIKYMALVSLALLLGACANSNTRTGQLNNAASEPLSYGSQSSSNAQEGVDVEGLGTQTSLDAVANDSLVYFGYDRYDLSADARSTLQSQTTWLKTHSTVNVVVEGHCDERGTREYNLALGDRRANSVKNYLVALGVDPSRVKTVSYGKERPAVIGSNEAAWAKNRRSFTRVN